jgi:hypothetical protein
MNSLAPHEFGICRDCKLTAKTTSLGLDMVFEASELPHRLVGEPARSIIDLDGGGHAGGKDNAWGHLIDMDADRDALGQAHPGEDGVDVGDALIVRLRVRNVDRAGDAVDAAAHDLAMAHQLDLGRVAHADGSEIRLLKISVDPE